VFIASLGTMVGGGEPSYVCIAWNGCTAPNADISGQDSRPHARRVVLLNSADLNLASTSSTLVAATRTPIAHDFFDDFKRRLIGGWVE